MTRIACCFQFFFFLNYKQQSFGGMSSQIFFQVQENCSSGPIASKAKLPPKTHLNSSLEAQGIQE